MNNEKRKWYQWFQTGQTLIRRRVFIIVGWSYSQRVLLTWWSNLNEFYWCVLEYFFSIKQMNYINYRVIKLIFNVFTLTLVLVLLFLFQSAKYSVYWRWACKPTYFKVEGKITDHKKTTFSLAWQAAAFLIFMRQ